MSATKSGRRDLRRRRRTRQHGCWDHLIVAPLWVAYRANLGTLLRTCDAVGACIAVPRSPHYREALSVGDTLSPGRRPCIHWLPGGKERWIADQRAAGWRVVAVELAEGSTPLHLVEPARQRTVVLLGHEREGIPDDLVEAADACVEIPHGRPRCEPERGRRRKPGPVPARGVGVTSRCRPGAERTLRHEGWPTALAGIGWTCPGWAQRIATSGQTAPQVSARSRAAATS